MAKVAIYDLKNKLHTLSLKDGSVIKLRGRKDKKVIDESQLTDTIKREAEAGLLAISKLPYTVPKSVSGNNQTNKSEVTGNDKTLEDKVDDTNKGNKNNKSSK